MKKKEILPQEIENLDAKKTRRQTGKRKVDVLSTNLFPNDDDDFLEKQNDMFLSDEVTQEDLDKSSIEPKKEETNQDETPKTINIRSLSFWIGVVAVGLGALEAILIWFNVKVEVNLLVEGISTVLFTLVCLGVLKTNNKNLVKGDIKSDIEEKMKDEKEEKKSKDKK